MAAITTTQKWCAALSYVVVGLLWYVFDRQLKHTSFLKFHAKQAVVFLLALIIVQMFAALLFFLEFLWLLLAVILLIIGISGVLTALRGEKKPLPLIGRFVKNLDL